MMQQLPRSNPRGSFWHRLLIALPLLPACALAALPVDDFEDADPGTPAGGEWITFSDSTSRVEWRPHVVPGSEGSQGCGRLSATMGSGSGWAGTTTGLGADWGEVDASAYAGVRLRLRGQGALRIQVPITATNAEYNHFSALVDPEADWRLVEIPFERFSQEFGTPHDWDPTTALQVSLVLGGARGETPWVEVDDVALYRADEAQAGPGAAVFVSPYPKVDGVGYEPGDRKRAVLTAPFGRLGDSIHLVDETGRRAWSGVFAQVFDDSASSGEHIVVADFTAFDRPGLWRVEAGGRHSAPFRIGSGVLAPLFADALKTFSSLRCGVAVDDARIGLAHPPCHLQDTLRRESPATRGDFTGGWHNAGDFGKWTHMAALSVAHMLWLVELDALRNGPAPRGDEALLAEARWGLEWLLRMQMPDGSVLHKVDAEPDFAWGSRPEDDHLVRRASYQGLASPKPSSIDAATAAAALAQGARVFAAFDPTFAQRCRQAAELSWTWLSANSGVGQTDQYYPDAASWQEELWSRAERARATRSDSLYQALSAALAPSRFQAVSWMTPQLLGALALWSDPAAPEAVRSKAEAVLVAVARGLQAKAEASGYGVAVDSDEFWWGSNENVLFRGGALLLGHLATGDSSLLHAARGQLDYILGVNALDTSFVAGYGTKAVRRPYHWSTMAYGTPLPGWVTAGPNNHAATLDDVAGDRPLYDLVHRPTPAAKSFLDRCASNGSYASNEGQTTNQVGLLFLAGWFAGPGAWSAPRVGVSPRSAPSARPSLAFVRDGTALRLSCPPRAGARVTISDTAGRVIATLRLDDAGVALWKPAGPVHRIIVAQVEEGPAAKILTP